MQVCPLHAHTPLFLDSSSPHPSSPLLKFPRMFDPPTYSLRFPLLSLSLRSVAYPLQGGKLTCYVHVARQNTSFSRMVFLPIISPFSVSSFFSFPPLSSLFASFRLPLHLSFPFSSFFLPFPTHSYPPFFFFFPSCFLPPLPPHRTTTVHFFRFE